MNLRASLLLATTVAFWPVWPWYLERVIETPDERVGLVALGTALAFALASGRERSLEPRDLWLPAALLWLYALTFAWLPALIRAALAFLVLGMIAVAGGRLGRLAHGLLAFAGLLLLALPALPSGQFYLGFPLRQLTAEGSALLLRLGGFAVEPEGTCLRWGDVVVAVDAPCSGLRMVWAGGYLTAVLALLHRLDLAKTLIVGMLTLGLVIAANMLRASCLFYLESGLLVGEPWLHEGVGLVVFAGAIAVIVPIVGRLAEWRR